MGKKKRPTTKRPIESTDKLLPKLTMALFGRPKTVFAIWLVILVFGIASYATLLRREGFPNITIPIAVVNGPYLVNDPAKVDVDVSKPISKIALEQPGVSTVLAQSNGNFANVTVQYEEGTDAKAATAALERAVNERAGLPESVRLQYNVPYFGATGGSVKKIDAAVSFYQSTNSDDTQALAAQAEKAVAYLNEHKPALAKEFFLESPYATATNPLTGESQVVQQTFDQFGVRDGGDNVFYNSVVIGVSAIDDVDVIELEKQLEDVLHQLESEEEFAGFKAHISASFAPAIEESISELQRVLMEGLIAVLIVGSIVIAIRASLITVASMITVITATLGLLYLLGYTLNVITLFALILGLALIVDDTIIMVEAIDAARRKTKSPKEAVRTATRKITRAMVAATATAALSFLPLAFVGGVLGSFIRAIPITIISALFISLLVALVFIPLFSRYLLLGKKQMGEKGVKEVAAGIESKIAHGLTIPMQWARGSSRKLYAVGTTAAVIGIAFVVLAGVVFSNVTFNLFPPTKDTNGLSVSLGMPQGTTITQAQAIAEQADALAAEEIGAEFKSASYYGLGSAESAIMYVELTPYGSRDETANQLVDKVQSRLDAELPEVQTQVAQVDIGPPASAFTVQISTESRDAGYRLANDVAQFMESTKLRRVNGSEAMFTDVSVSTQSSVVRSNGTQVIRVNASFDADDTTTLVGLAQDAITTEFSSDRVASYGVESDALGFDLGQEADNQESFNGLVVAFPIVLAVIFLLLVVEFRSLLQPLLIFLAIPFSLLGVTLGLYLTDNAFSFFTAMGFFALIGLSIKNTILLVDYANQARKAGMMPIDAAVAALEERFRPLVATSLTAVFSLIPLAIISPFWQGLAMVLIGGLLSSTFLVITVFPYYYLAGEYLRMNVSRKSALTWLGGIALVIWVVSQLAASGAAIAVGLLFAVLYPIVSWRLRRVKRSV